MMLRSCYIIRELFSRILLKTERYIPKMENFKFCSPTEFIFGRGVEKETGAALARFGASKVMIVYGSDRAERTGLMKRITDSLVEAGIGYVKFGGIQPNPTA